ncbi:MAG: hypothetical protein M1828_004166 [Chrysothrix sp. TS-e1954]|nr:MAG: hypothetical protein M1828_004166 [Chrysothrix sp. TS-e1954]
MLDKAKTGESVDLGRWVQMYTFDVLGELFFGSMFGFLATGTDINSYIEALDNILPVMATAGACPKMVQKYVFPLAMLLPSTRRALPSLQHIEKSSQQRVEERHLHMKEGKPLRRDMLAKLFEIARDKGDEKDFHHADIQIECHTALAAGSDTTAIALRAIFYYLMKAPTTYTRLLQEVDTATSNGDLSDPVKYSEAIKMPYLCAVIKEAMRLHPSVGLTLPRYVPTGGVQLAGHFIPAGYQVGINGAVVQYDRNVFGADAEAFNPDRWLERDAAMMEKHMMTFGSGTRTCIGKNM